MHAFAQRAKPTQQAAFMRAASESSPLFRARPTAHAPADVHEHEADIAAADVMQKSEPRLARACCPACSDEKDAPRESAESGGPTDAPPIVDRVLASPGRPLDSASRAFFEPYFQSDFSGVRVHDDAKAGDSAEALDASAYTV